MKDQTEKIRRVLYFLLETSEKGYVQVTQTELITKYTKNLITAIKECGYYIPGNRGRNNNGKITYSTIMDSDVEKIENRLKELLESTTLRLTKIKGKPQVENMNIDSFEKILQAQEKTNELLAENNKLMLELVSIWR